MLMHGPVVFELADELLEATKSSSSGCSSTPVVHTDTYSPNRLPPKAAVSAQPSARDVVRTRVFAETGTGGIALLVVHLVCGVWEFICAKALSISQGHDRVRHIASLNHLLDTATSTFSVGVELVFALVHPVAYELIAANLHWRGFSRDFEVCSECTWDKARKEEGEDSESALHDDGDDGRTEDWARGFIEN